MNIISIKLLIHIQKYNTQQLQKFPRPVNGLGERGPSVFWYILVTR